MLLTAGFKVAAGDVSVAMLKITKKNFESYKSDPKILSRDIQFKTIDILDTGFDDNEFDGVVCYRLFHLFYDSTTRHKGMAELKRISRGPVLISFFNSFSIIAYTRRTKYLFKGRMITDRVPIKMNLHL
ncbi:MAG: class I SAM-dependent methyltransferase [Deltaproteobacteria bacterium]|nr:class I SAM-dependent methyltransferase [Deltaproteobacteria bacterium]